MIRLKIEVREGSWNDDDARVRLLVGKVKNERTTENLSQNKDLDIGSEEEDENEGDHEN